MACRHFQTYLLGRHFKACTDHKGLTWIFNVTDPSSRLLRCRLLLSKYDFEVIYRAWKTHVNADGLSRYPEVNVINVTEDIKKKIIQEMHDCLVGGHQGVNRTVNRIKLYTNWAGLERDVRNYIRNCQVC